MNLLPCYCVARIKESGLGIVNTVFPARNEELCWQWLKAYGTSNGMMLAIVLFVSIAKLGINFILPIIARFERKHSMTAELASGSLKIFVSQFINAVLSSASHSLGSGYLPC
jgi:hypothetical protein